MRLKFFLLSAICASLIGCLTHTGNKNSYTQKTPSDLDLVYNWMQGHFDSETQAKTDKDYFPISLEMRPILIEGQAGLWLYVEQAMMSALDKPYRQRVYQVSVAPNGEIASAVFTLKNPEKFVQAWTKNTLATLNFEALEPRDGCTVYLKREQDAFVGGTQGKKCVSDLRGASYAVSNVRIDASQLTSWDRGFDNNDKQVWGAEKGPYIFLRANAKR